MARDIVSQVENLKLVIITPFGPIPFQSIKLLNIYPHMISFYISFHFVAKCRISIATTINKKLIAKALTEWSCCVNKLNKAYSNQYLQTSTPVERGLYIKTKGSQKFMKYIIINGKTKRNVFDAKFIIRLYANVSHLTCDIIILATT